MQHTQETEALILEQQLIKEYKPKFNILLRDDKTYPFIYFLGSHDFPSIHLKRSKQATDENFYGPYTNAKLVRDQIKELQKILDYVIVRIVPLVIDQDHVLSIK